MQLIKAFVGVAAMLALGAHAADTNSTTTKPSAAPSVAQTSVPLPTPVPTPVPTPTPKPVNTTAAGNGTYLPGTLQPYGALHEDKVGPRNVDDLMMAMTNRTNYAEAVGRPICIVEVKKVMVQVVSGYKYRFTVEGCSQTFAESLGPCNEAGCKEPALWEVSVYAQPWTNTYKVEKIDFLG